MGISRNFSLSLLHEDCLKPRDDITDQDHGIEEDAVGPNIVSLVTKCVIVLMYWEVLYPLTTFHVLGGIVPSNLENSINSSDVSGSGNRLMIMIMMVMKTTTKMKVMMRTLERVKRCTAWKCNTGGDQPSINWDSLLRSRIAICWIRKPRYIKIAVQVIFQLELQETLGILKYNTIHFESKWVGNLARRHHDDGGR